MAHFSKRDLDEMEERTKLAVFGYVRRCQQELQQCIIPDLVTFVVLQYYGDRDSFHRSLCGEGITILDGDKSITNKDSKQIGLFTVYGTTVIDSMVDACYVWKFEQLGTDTYCTNFGIAPENGSLTATAFYLAKDKGIYAYHCGGSNCASGHTYSWQQSERSGWPRFVNMGDILTMTLRFRKSAKSGNLSFQINETEEFEAFSDVVREQGLSYRLAVCNNTGHQVMKIRMLSSF